MNQHDELVLWVPTSIDFSSVLDFGLGLVVEIVLVFWQILRNSLERLWRTLESIETSALKFVPLFV